MFLFNLLRTSHVLSICCLNPGVTIMGSSNMLHLSIKDESGLSLICCKPRVFQLLRVSAHCADDEPPPSVFSSNSTSENVF